MSKHNRERKNKLLPITLSHCSLTPDNTYTKLVCGIPIEEQQRRAAEREAAYKLRYPTPPVYNYFVSVQSMTQEEKNKYIQGIAE